MPLKPAHPCTVPFCPRFAVPGSSRCVSHTKKDQEVKDIRRGNSGERGYDKTWQRVRNMKANQNPLCEECLAVGIERPLDVIHHVNPIETHPELRLVMDNLVSLCQPHHEAIHGKDRWKIKPQSGKPIC